MRTEVKLTTSQLVEVARIIELYRVAFKKNSKEMQYLTGAKSMLRELNCMTEEAITKVLSRVRVQVDEEQRAYRQELQDEYEMMVEYEM